MRARDLTLIALCVCVASAAPSVARADDPPPPETADSLYNQGNEAYDRQDLKLAYELYKGAFKLRQSYDIARNLGLCELKLGKYKAAVEHFNYSLSLYPSNRADTKKQVVEWLEQAKAEVGTLRLEVEPESAACKVNGEAVAPGEGERDVVLDPGEAKIECSAAGYRAERRAATVTKGERAEVKITLERGATIKAPSVPKPVEISPATRRTIVWIGSAAAVAGVGAGAVTGVLSLTKASEAESRLAKIRASSGRDAPCLDVPRPDGCDAVVSLRREQDLFGNVAFWTLLAGGVVGAGTAAYGLATRRSDSAAPAPRTAVLPVILPGAGAVVVSGSW